MKALKEILIGLGGLVIMANIFALISTWIDIKTIAVLENLALGLVIIKRPLSSKKVI